MRAYEGESSSDPKAIIAVVIIAGLIGYAVLDSLAKWLGVNIEAAFTLVMGVVCTIALLGIGLWSQSSDSWPLTVANVSPLALSTFVMAWSPALNQLGCIGPIGMCWEIKWWGSSYTHYGLSFAVLIIGYGYLYLRRDRY